MKRYRLFVFPAVGMLLVLLGFLGYGLLSDSLVYFKTPTELMQVTPDTGRIRLGGQVMGGTVVQEEGAVAFEVGDGQTVVAVLHKGAPSQLFNEEIGVVVEGRWDGSIFHSDTMLIKHDEQYRTEDGATYRPGSGSEE